MSVILTGMDIPESCANCPICHCKGKDDPWNYYCAGTMDDINIEEWDKERYITCPLKSIDGLIEYINLEICSPNYYCSETETAGKIIDIIKEYCEV